jgi:hypothetical protein
VTIPDRCYFNSGAENSIVANDDDRTTAASLAGGIIAAALLEALFDKGVFDLMECRAVLDRAMQGLSPVMKTPVGWQAAQIIGSLQRGKFALSGSK